MLLLGPLSVTNPPRIFSRTYTNWLQPRSLQDRWQRLVKSLQLDALQSRPEMRYFLDLVLSAADIMRTKAEGLNIDQRATDSLRSPWTRMQGLLVTF